MSVINELLSKIPSTQGSDGYFVGEIHPVEHTPSLQKGRAWIGFGIIVLLLVFLAFIFFKPYIETASVVKTVPIQTLPIPEPQVAVQVPQTVELPTLKNVAIEKSLNTSQLILEFSKPVEYRLEDDENLGQWRLIIDQMASQPTWPSLDLASTLLKSVDWQVKEGKGIITLTVVMPVHVQSRFADESKTRLMVELRKREETAWQGPASAFMETEAAALVLPSQSPVKKNTSVRQPSSAISEDLLEQADDLLAKERYADAIRPLETLLELKPSRHDIREKLVSALLELESYDAADEVVSAGLLLSPKRPQFLMQKARILLAKNQPAEGIRWLLRATVPITKFPDYYALLGVLYQESHQYENALKIYQRLITHNPKDGRWFLGAAVALDHLNRTAESLQYYQAALQNEEFDLETDQFIRLRIEAASRQK